MTNSLFQVDQVAYQAPDGYVIIEQAKFNVQAGEAVLITGPSGSGKSTILKLLANMISPTAGRILYQVQSLQDLDPTQYRQDVSYFFQNPVLFDQTVEDNLAFPYLIRQQAFDQERAIAWLNRVKLDASYLAKGIDELSGGERQRVAFVRNLMFSPQVLLLDEVTASLDRENREIIAEVLASLRQEQAMTLLMVSHMDEDLTSFDRMIEMNHKKAGEIHVSK